MDFVTLHLVRVGYGNIYFYYFPYTLPLPAFAVQDGAKIKRIVDFEVYVSFPMQHKLSGVISIVRAGTDVPSIAGAFLASLCKVTSNQGRRGRIASNARRR